MYYQRIFNSATFGICNEVWIELAWDKEIKNKAFKPEMKKYKKQLAKWEKQNVKS